MSSLLAGVAPLRQAQGDGKITAEDAKDARERNFHVPVTRLRVTVDNVE